MNRAVRRTMVVLAVAACAALIAVLSWRLLRPTATTPSAVPPRHPELYGVIEKTQSARDSVRSYELHLVHCLKPPAGMAESEQNQWQRQINLDVWVIVFDETPVARRADGAPARLRIGQTVSAWCSGPMLTTDPPQWAADSVIVEADVP